MIVVSVLMIAIAPVMAFSVATRVQARRTELASQAAKAYIDALRTGTLRYNDPTSPAGFPKRVTTANVADAEAPGSTAGLYCVNLDDKPDCQTDSSKDFYVQGAWLSKLDPPAPNTDDPTTIGYELMVRVYRADSFANGVTRKTNPKDEKKQSIVGSGLGDRTMPVVEMTTQIPPTTNGGSSAYRSLCSRLEGSAGCQ